MIFVQFLKSLDELLYEIVTWLIFFPITLWRVIRGPWDTMDYADDELADAEDEQYTDTLSPPIFLLIALLLSHAIELQLFGQSSLIASNRGLARLITDDTSLLLMRLLFFSIFPLVMSVRLLRKRKLKLTRNSLRLPFYAQCYPTAIFALTLGIGTLMLQMHRGTIVTVVGAIVALGAFVWFGTVQAGWFRRKLKISHLRGFWTASVGMAECLLAFALAAPLVI